jgi:TctA family transporter
MGILPGGGAVIASFAAYTFEEEDFRDPSRFGRGAIRASPRRKAHNWRGRADLVHPPAR